MVGFLAAKGGVTSQSALRIVFAGTPDFALPPLDALLASKHKVVAVYTQPDRPAGRGRKLAVSPIKQRAAEAGLPVIQPISLRPPAEIEQLASFRPDVMVVVAYGLILPVAILAVPRYGCFNIHASLLPRWRGAAPIQRAIQAGDRETGITIMQMDKGLDTGPMLLRSACPIEPNDTAQTLHDRLAALGSVALLQVLAALNANALTPVEQDGRYANYAAKLDKAESWLDWQLPALQLEQTVRAFNPWPVARTLWNELPLHIWQVAALPGKGDNKTIPGTVIAATKEGLDVVTGKGVLRLLALQSPGGRRLAVADFLNAQRVTVGSILRAPDKPFLSAGDSHG